ncbi:hypothetical protein KGF57_000331 [Candida theae]|uniref:AMP-dependent synthetase/ligase domain-containing protein n=1 Tax=Candida theae TaxID=1198502 RepID=A0AAD5BJU3_9ASCO|nr:uncharacterized protein KGF57_000331 [Candida theae]KAI5967603.1 hypothetical protein KGF57_000331 [Candida theae]
MRGIGVEDSGGVTSRHCSKVTIVTFDCILNMAALFKEKPEHIWNTISEDFPLNPSLRDRAVPLAGSKVPGYSPIYRNVYSQKELKSVPYPGITTLYDTFELCAANNGDKPAFGHRVQKEDGKFGEYVWQDYNTVQKRRNNLGSGLFFVLENNPYKTDSEAHKKLKYDPLSDESFVLTMFSHNRPEWALADLMSAAYSITNTALYDTLGPDTSKYILNLTECPVVLCSKDKVKVLVELKEKNPEALSNLICIVSMDDLTTDDAPLKNYCHDHNISLFDYKQVEKLGEINPLDPIPPKPETTFTITFTSGTTGANPKGVLLTHENAVAGVTFSLSAIPLPKLYPTFYSFLPLAHIYERLNLHFATALGAAIGYPQGRSPLTLLEDVQVLQPDILSLVPRVLTKLEAGIKAQTINNDENPILKSLFTKAINAKMELITNPANENTNPSHLLYDRVLGLLRKKMGMGKLVGFVTGAAPISPETVKFLKASLNCGLGQGYGMSETFSGIMASSIHETEASSCGPVCITTEVKTRDLPEMGYTSKDEGGPRGELLVRGPQIFREYYKNPEETAKSFDEEGWFHTGDVARIDARTGRTWIIDRVKNFFKLAQGEYVTPERIENTYLSCFPYLAQMFVHGDSLRTHLVGVVGVDPVSITSYIKGRHNETINDPADLVRFFGDPQRKRQLLIDMNASLGDKLQGFEKLHNIEVDIEPLSLEKNLITPTMKIKRPVCTKYFKQTLDKLYEEGSLIKGDKL